MLRVIAPLDLIPGLCDLNGIWTDRDFSKRVSPVPQQCVGVTADDHVQSFHLSCDLVVFIEARVPHGDEYIHALALQSPRLRSQ